MSGFFRQSLRKTAISINWIWVSLCALFFITPYVDPRWFWPFHFLSYSGYILLSGLIVFLLFWLIRRSVWLLLPTITLFIGYPQFNKLYKWSAKPEVSTVSQSYRLLSYNLQLFRHADQRNPQPLIDSIRFFLLKENPDVLCLQEYSTYVKKKKEQLTNYLKENGWKWHYFHVTKKAFNENQGQAIFSKHRIIKHGMLSFNDKFSKLNGCIYADVLFPFDTVRIINFHLQSNLIRTDEYEYLNQVSNDSYLQRTVVWKVINKIKTAVEKRAEQSECIRQSVMDSPHPVIVAGDLNDTPSSYAYRIVRNQLNDTYALAGSGRANTYNGPLPSFRIDHVFVSPVIQVLNHSVVKQDFSDHFPVMIEFTSSTE
jgi:endonuclease/exonuclease/phosphatase family metal-dependent hydrolase